MIAPIKAGMRVLTPQERAASHRHTAAVCRSEAEVRRLTQPDFAATLDTWAANHEQRAIDADQFGQPDLFTTPSSKAIAA